MQTDLGVVGKAHDNKVEVAVPEDEKDINAAYEDALAVINRFVYFSVSCAGDDQLTTLYLANLLKSSRNAVQVKSRKTITVNSAQSSYPLECNI